MKHWIEEDITAKRMAKRLMLRLLLPPRFWLTWISAKCQSLSHSGTGMTPCGLDDDGARLMGPHFAHDGVELRMTIIIIIKSNFFFIKVKNCY
jgi:hypothetical protein